MTPRAKPLPPDERRRALLDAAPLRRRLERIDHGGPLEERLLAVLEAFHERFRGAFDLMTAVGKTGPSESLRADSVTRRVLEVD